MKILCKYSSVKGLIFAALFLFVTGNLYAKEITILYTGSTHAMLYHCNCPIEPDGGVARRAALINEIRRSKPTAVLVDSGDFFAGGLADEYTQNTQLDMTRTEANLKAVALMKYDALALGDNEFNFGADYFQDSVKKYKLNVLSCNAKLPGLMPYTIKEVSGIKIGIIGVTNLYAKQKASSIDIAEPVESVKRTVKEVKDKGADLVMVLSNLNEPDNMVLINDIAGIDILLVGQRAKQEGAVKVGSTIMLYPAWQGRKLGRLTLNVKDNRIENYKAELLRLSDKIKDDPQVQAELPRCFSDMNCKEGAVMGNCVNPGTASANCEVVKSKKVKLTVITLKNCVACDPQRIMDYLKPIFPGLEASYLYYPDAKSSALIKDFGIKGLPAFLLGKEIENETSFDKLKSGLEKKGDYYLLKPEVAGVSYYLDREKKKGTLDLFISLFDKDSAAILEAIKDFNPDIHFLVTENRGYFEAARGTPEVEECLRSVCVKKYYPQQFWNYLICRAKNIGSSWWENCLGDLDSSRIKTCATGDEGKALLKDNIALNRQLQIMYGPEYLLDNQEIFSTSGIPNKEEFKKIFRK